MSLVLALLVGPTWAEPPDSWTFRRGELVVDVVGKEAEFDETRAYQIVVRDELRTLARLEVNRDGLVTDVWLTDLDGDGAFEIVVATAQLGGADIGAADVHEWRDFRFDSTKTAPLSAEQAATYRGNDQFTLVDGGLRRSYPEFIERTGGVVPSGKMVELEYRYGDNRWVVITR